MENLQFQLIDNILRYYLGLDPQILVVTPQHIMDNFYQIGPYKAIKYQNIYLPLTDLSWTIDEDYIAIFWDALHAASIEEKKNHDIQALFSLGNHPGLDQHLIKQFELGDVLGLAANGLIYFYGLSYGVLIPHALKRYHSHWCCLFNDEKLYVQLLIGGEWLLLTTPDDKELLNISGKRRYIIFPTHRLPGFPRVFAVMIE